MAKSLNIVRQFGTRDLIEFLNKNGYGEFDEVLTQQFIKGDDFLNLSEFEISRWKVSIGSKRRLWLFLMNLKRDPDAFLNKTQTTNRPQVATVRPRIVEKNRPIQTELENVLKNQSENQPKRPPKARLPSPPPSPISPAFYLPMEIPKPSQNSRHIDDNGYLLPNEQTVAISERSPMVLPRDPPEHDYIDNAEIGVDEHYEPAPETLRKPVITINDKNEIGLNDNTGTLTKFKNLLKKIHENHQNNQQKTNIYANQNMESQGVSNKTNLMPNDIRLRPLPPLPSDNEATNEEQIVIYENNESKDNEIGVIYENNETVEKKLPLPPVNLPKVTPNFNYFNTENRPEKSNSFTNLSVMIEEISELAQQFDDVEDLDDYDECVFNLNDEPFYRNTDRKGAKRLLQNLDDGAFLFRPSRHYFLTITIKHGSRFFNLGIERTTNNKIRCQSNGSSTSPEFATINDFIKYFSRNPLTFHYETTVVEVFLKKSLKSDVF